MFYMHLYAILYDFWKETHLMNLDPTSEDTGGSHEGGGRAQPPRARPLPRGAPVAPPTYPLHPYISTYPKTSRTKDRSGVPPPQASVATENQSRPVPAPCRRGNPSPVAIFINPTLSMTRRECSPSGLRVCTSSYLFDLSLSLSLVFFIWHDLDVSRA